MKKKYSYNENSNKTVWIDLDNSPHVPFFAPIIKRMQASGYDIKISIRKYSQTAKLAKLFNLDYQAIGKHHGKNKFIKVLGLFYRAIQLFPFALKNKPVIAISHGSRSQMLVAFLLRIPIVMFLDYEFIQTLPFVKPKVIMLPNLISTEKLKSIGAKIISYPGIKEDIYVPSFIPDNSIVNQLGLKPDKISVVVRPPAHEAHYHNPESEILFDEIILHLVQIKNIKVIIMPRDDGQKLAIKEQYKEHFDNSTLIIPNEVIDGLNIIWHSDLVISGGGTMNREATALGVPVYSIFRGKIGDVDKYLEKKGKLVLIDDINDIKNKIKIQKHNKIEKLENLNSLALHSVVKSLENIITDKPSSITETKETETNYEYKISNSRESKA